jgi:hypothetical protein
MTDHMTPDAAARLLRDWGFLVHADLPDRPGQSHLLIAIRPLPTEHHYDPERVTYWVTKGGKGAHAEITHATPLPIETPFSWGTIRVEDRFAVANEWVSCGGELDASDVDGETICVFRSDVPILRRGGHSQGWDHAAANLAAFFGRIKVAVDYVPGFEQQVAAATPRVRFAAFVADLAARYRASHALVDVHPDLWALLVTEESRLRDHEPATWQAGQQLAQMAAHVDVTAAAAARPPGR